MELLYQILEEKVSWDSALAQLADQLHADHIILDTRHELSDDADDMIATRVAVDHVDALSKHPEYLAFRKMLGGIEEGRAHQFAGFVDMHALTRSALYNEVVHPMGGGHALFAKITQDANRAMPNATLLVCRNNRRGTFTSQSVQRLQHTLPHLRTVLGLYQKLNALPTQTWWQEQVLENLPLGIFILNKVGGIIHANRQGSQLLGLSTDLYVTPDGRLSLRHPAACGQLHEAVNDAAAHRLPASGQFIPVRNGNGADYPQNRFHLKIVPLSKHSAVAESWKASAMVFCETRSEHTDQYAARKTWWGLTHQEATLADALARGDSLRQAATRMEISYETTRTHLRGLFNKTSTNKQLDLVCLLNTFERLN